MINSEARNIRVGISPLINPLLVARTYTAVRELPTAHDLVLREANMKELHEGLLAGELDVILIPAVKPLPHFEHRIIDSEPVVIVESTQDSTEPVELSETQDKPFILVPDTCGLTTFTNQLFETNDLALNAYSSEAASYQVLEQWATLGLGSAILPLSKLSSPTAPHRPLREQGLDMEIFYEAVWSPGTNLSEDIEKLARLLTETES